MPQDGRTCGGKARADTPLLGARLSGGGGGGGLALGGYGIPTGGDGAGEASGKGLSETGV